MERSAATAYVYLQLNRLGNINAVDYELCALYCTYACWTEGMWRLVRPLVCRQGQHSVFVDGLAAAAQSPEGTGELKFRPVVDTAGCADTVAWGDFQASMGGFSGSVHGGGMHWRCNKQALVL